MSATQTVVVTQPPVAVFAALADPRHPAGRSAEIVGAEVPEPIGPGSRFRLEFRSASGRLSWLSGRVTDYEPPRLVSYDVRGGRGILRTQTTFEVEPKGSGAEVRGTFQLSPPWILRKRVQHALQAHVDATVGRLQDDLA